MRSFGRKMGKMGSTGNFMKQIQKAMQQAQEMESGLAAEVVEGSAGGGMVKVTANGIAQVTSVKIDPQVVDPDDVEMLEDLVVAAVRDAVDKARALRDDRMKEVTGGMPIPGMF